jgi:hypothetical protein
VHLTAFYFDKATTPLPSDIIIALPLRLLHYPHSQIFQLPKAQHNSKWLQRKGTATPEQQLPTLNHKATVSATEDEAEEREIRIDEAANGVAVAVTTPTCLVFPQTRLLKMSPLQLPEPMPWLLVKQLKLPKMTTAKCALSARTQSLTTLLRLATIQHVIFAACA